MTFWIDGDSCPRRAMDIVLSYAGREALEIVVAADRIIPGVEAGGAAMRVLEHGSGEVDDFILRGSREGDLALTRDYRLGIRLMEAGVAVLNDRGRIWTLEDLRKRVEDAGIMQAMRAGGMAAKSLRDYGDADAAAFSSALGRLLSDSGPA